jgi:lysophospholipase L1-like esterase
VTKTARLALALSLFIGTRAAGQSAPEPFRNGDRWCAVGDSITHGGSYHQWIWLYYLTRFPDRTIDLSNAGISGDTAAGGGRRLEWDILPNRPTVATVMFGMNDVGRTLYDTAATPELEEKRRERLATYKESQTGLVKALQQRGARVILVTPSIYDETAELERPRQVGVNGALGECTSFLKTLAAESGATLVDFHTPMTRFNADYQRADIKRTIVGPDRVHPGPPGHLYMAYLFLRAQAAPATVASLAIDARKRHVTSAINGRADKIRGQKNGLSFVWTENALPFPVSTEAAPALDWVPFRDELDQETLQITGLKSGRYELLIDDALVGAFSADDLARGVNLAAEAATPQNKQAQDVLAIVEKRRKLIAERLRAPALVEHRLAPEGSQPVTLEVMKPLIDEQLELYKTHPPAAIIQRATEAYMELKPKQAEALAEAGRLAEEARRAAQPKRHMYQLKAAD